MSFTKRQEILKVYEYYVENVVKDRLNKDVKRHLIDVQGVKL